MRRVSARGDVLTIDGTRHKLDYPVEAFIDLHSVVVVLYDPDVVQRNWGQFANLVGLTRAGDLHWTAELPTTESGDRYYSLSLEEGLVVADSVKSFSVRLEPRTGIIVDQTFTK